MHRRLPLRLPGAHSRSMILLAVVAQFAGTLSSETAAAGGAQARRLFNGSGRVPGAGRADNRFGATTPPRPETRWQVPGQTTTR